MSEQNKPEAGSEFQFQPNSTRPDDSAFKTAQSKKPWQMPGFPWVTYSLLALTVLFTFPTGAGANVRLRSALLIIGKD